MNYRRCDKIYYELERLKPRIFEILAANYALHFAPQYEWHLTRQTGDYNRDFESMKDAHFKWGEAKHTEHYSTAVSKSRWDPTLLSAQLSNNVDMIFLITCGWIPLEYIVRAEHLRNSNTVIKKIAYINRDILDRWLSNDQITFCNFDEKNLNMSNIMRSIIKENDSPKTHSSKVIINIYSEYNNSMLEPQFKLEMDVPYEINITIFTSQDEFTLKIDLPDSFKIIDKIQLKNLSSIDDEDRLFDNTTKEFNLNIGYNQILIHGLFDNFSAGLSGVISAENTENQLLGKCKFTVVDNIVQPNNSTSSEIIKVENLYNECLETKQNNKLYTKHLKKNDLIRNHENNAYIAGYYCYSFNGSYSDNAKTLCQLASKLFFGIDLQDSDEKTIPIIFNSVKKYFDFFLLDLVIGTVNIIFALSTINTIMSSEDSTHRMKLIPLNIPYGTIFFLEGVANLNDTLRIFLNSLLSAFIMNTNASIIIVDVNSRNLEISSKKKLYQYNDSDHKCKELLIDEIYKKNGDIDFNRILKEADKLYERTDFYGALFFYDYLYSKSGSEYTDLKYLFRYADCLNHCGSMNKSISIFKYISNQSYDNSPYMRIILEAHTEVFNIRFWQMDTKELISDIDKFLKTFYDVLLSGNEDRDLYSYYNCLNRKMTTQYLIGDYDAAEKTYHQYIDAIDERHLNYLAFAYMDSARGLYRKNIVCAQERMYKAYKILGDLFHTGKEQRRFYDCAVEIEYIDFVIKYNQGEHPNTDGIESAILNVKANGYRNMLLKCYLKLASCYIALNRVNDALKCMRFVKNNCDFEENVRVEVLYNSIMKNMFDAINHNIVNQKPISEDFVESSSIIKFNCDTRGTILLETRVW